MKIDFTNEELHLLTAVIGTIIEAESKNLPSNLSKKEQESFENALVGLSLKVLMANRKLEQDDQAMDAEIL